MGLGDFANTDGIILLTKDPGEPALYWHQDWMRWNDPMSSSPWPQIIFVSYYLGDTSRESGCLKIIPGTHLKRIPLHDQLVPAHEQGARFIAEDHPTMFSDLPDQVEVCVKAGDLVLTDARVLHSAHRNLTEEHRTLVLAWHRRPDTVPAYLRPIQFRPSFPSVTPRGNFLDLEYRANSCGSRWRVYSIVTIGNR